MTLSPAGLSQAVQDKFPHLATVPALTLPAGADAPMLLKGQLAVSALDSEGALIDATGLQIPGVLDDLYTFTGDLGVTWDAGVPSIALWAPTAQSVTLHIFDTSTISTSTTYTMTWDGATGVWAKTGMADWTDKYYLFEVDVYAPSTQQIEQNIVTDPYAVSLSTNSTRSQIVDLTAAALKPAGWDALAKPALAAPEDITIYEIHVRDFSVNDATVPDELKGTFKAFTLPESNGVKHLKALEAAGLSHLHLLPVFDIATIDEDKANWQTPDFTGADMGPASEDQQAAVVAVENTDAFNWGYDPFHYGVPEGSYSTDPDGTTRIVEFREMVEALNNMGLRVVVDVVYNHTNAAGQAEKSVLDKIVPGYYQRLNASGQVESSTCCANTATEHNMMEKLMVDTLVLWAKEYKVDSFRFDLMGHHMVRNMVAVRAALDALTLANGRGGRQVHLSLRRGLELWRGGGQRPGRQRHPAQHGAARASAPSATACGTRCGAPAPSLPAKISRLRALPTVYTTIPMPWPKAARMPRRPGCSCSPTRSRWGWRATWPTMRSWTARVPRSRDPRWTTTASRPATPRTPKRSSPISTSTTTRRCTTSTPMPRPRPPAWRTGYASRPSARRSCCWARACPSSTPAATSCAPSLWTGTATTRATGSTSWTSPTPPTTLAWGCPWPPKTRRTGRS